MFNQLPTTTRAERLDKTLLTMLNAGMPIPLKVIASRQGLKVTPYIRDIVAKLIDDENVTGEMVRANGFDVYLYRLTEAGQRVAEAVKAARL